MSRYVLILNNQEISRHTTLAVAKKKAAKHPRFEPFVVQDTAPKGKPGETVCIGWRYRGRGAWEEALFHTIPEQNSAA